MTLRSLHLEEQESQHNEMPEDASGDAPDDALEQGSVASEVKSEEEPFVTSVHPGASAAPGSQSESDEAPASKSSGSSSSAGDGTFDVSHYTNCREVIRTAHAVLITATDITVPSQLLSMTSLECYCGD